MRTALSSLFTALQTTPQLFKERIVISYPADIIAIQRTTYFDLHHFGCSKLGYIVSSSRVGTKRRPKTQKRRPLQNRLEITLKWFERDYRPTQKRETTRFAFFSKFDQGLRFVHNPTKSTKRKPPQNRLEITSKWFDRDCRPKQKRETTRFAFTNKFDQGLRFVHNPTKCTKRRPLQNRLDMS